MRNPTWGEIMAVGHSARPLITPQYERILSDMGWVYPDGRKALTAKETRKRVPDKAATAGFSLVNRGWKNTQGEEHNNKRGTQVHNQLELLRENGCEDVDPGGGEATRRQHNVWLDLGDQEDELIELTDPSEDSEEENFQ